ncbi:MAG TPA: hypothetical protein VK437_12620 [Steroidobacteraceae bacterium]|nr:hypothetical protein [Steroidobacteraceae bacterium]
MRLAPVCLVAGLVACATTSQELIGEPRAPLSPDKVQLFLEQPARKFEQIALINASSKHSFALTAQGKAEVVIRRLKQAAAKLGANGVLLQGISDESSGSADTTVGTEYEGPRGIIDLSLGASALMLERRGRAIAIYVQPEGTL